MKVLSLRITWLIVDRTDLELVNRYRVRVRVYCENHMPATIQIWQIREVSVHKYTAVDPNTLVFFNRDAYKVLVHKYEISHLHLIMPCNNTFCSSR